MQTTKINAAGQWLRPDAAASYLRMIADGMPSGGISAQGAGRTRAVQLWLYALWKAGRGNLAAFHSLHEQGAALDMTRGTPAQRWMTVVREAEVDQSGHLRECPSRRAPWELHISDTDITEF